ncbi:hypothetical protein O6H91_02G044000 [Diphasiastrum complanatum]|uniref:Uncharacterized protein n=1 Tax=Diphasiastrum complanatum TaxID=34168 RepID=A0ACC2EEU3_DIPCM|nr:hypothetical protein O6H91_02G044000 [Diphasiastrum complanatum]
MQGLSTPMRAALLPLLHSRSAVGNAFPCLSNRGWVRDIGLYSKSIRMQANPAQKFCTTASAIGSETSGNQDRKIFANFAFYKGKSAMNITPMKPIFKLAETGSAFIYKEGALFLEIAPAVGQRKYDWNKKQVFALSVLELGTLLGLSPEEGCEFYHDPNMGKSDAGMVRKVFKVEPMADKSGYFFNLAVSNKLDKSDGRLSIPISKAEFAVIRSAINYIIPYLMGWHVIVDPLKLADCMPSKDLKSDGPSLVKDARMEWAK